MSSLFLCSGQILSWSRRWLQHAIVLVIVLIALMVIPCAVSKGHVCSIEGNLHLFCIL